MLIAISIMLVENPLFKSNYESYQLKLQRKIWHFQSSPLQTLYFQWKTVDPELFGYTQVRKLEKSIKVAWIWSITALALPNCRCLKVLKGISVSLTDFLWNSQFSSAPVENWNELLTSHHNAPEEPENALQTPPVREMNSRRSGKSAYQDFHYQNQIPDRAGKRWKIFMNSRCLFWRTQEKRDEKKPTNEFINIFKSATEKGQTWREVAYLNNGTLTYFMLVGNQLDFCFFRRFVLFSRFFHKC